MSTKDIFPFNNNYNHACATAATATASEIPNQTDNNKPEIIDI